MPLISLMRTELFGRRGVPIGGGLLYYYYYYCYYYYYY